MCLSVDRDVRYAPFVRLTSVDTRFAHRAADQVGVMWIGLFPSMLGLTKTRVMLDK